MCAKTIFGANKRGTPGGFSPSKRKIKPAIDSRLIVDAANRVLDERNVRAMSFANHDIIFGKRKP